MPLLFYGRLERGKRKLYSSDLRPIETNLFDNWKVKYLAPHPRTPDLANFWWFKTSKHSAISWHDSRDDIKLPHGIASNHSGRLIEQTIFIPALLSQLDALEIIRTSFPRYLVPSPLMFRFNNENEVYQYD